LANSCCPSAALSDCRNAPCTARHRWRRRWWRHPDRIIWGTDWPHPNSDFGRGKPLSEIAPPFPIDDGLLLNQLAKWVPDAGVRRKILVDNPARLYGFG
jgi:predicted TIM-barrel fold metal-dependent hydrolase